MHFQEWYRWKTIIYQHLWLVLGQRKIGFRFSIEDLYNNHCLSLLYNNNSDKHSLGWSVKNTFWIYLRRGRSAIINERMCMNKYFFGCWFHYSVHFLLRSSFHFCLLSSYFPAHTTTRALLIFTIDSCLLLYFLCKPL